MNNHLFLQIKTLESIHNKAIAQNNHKLAKWAVGELQPLYASQWGMPYKLEIEEI